MKFWREIAVGVCLFAACAAIGAAVDVRDRTAAVEHETKSVEAIQAERDKLILYRLDRMDSKLDALTARP